MVVIDRNCVYATQRIMGGIGQEKLNQWHLQTTTKNMHTHTHTECAQSADTVISSSRLNTNKKKDQLN